MGHSKSSRQWLQEHFSDPYVQRAQREGHRGRAVYKLLELDERYQLLRPGMRVLDLGAAPGSWSEVAATKVGPKGRVIASDILPMDAIEGVTFIQGDFREDEVLDNIFAAMDGEKVDLVLSDMAPNMSGMGVVDQPRAMLLAELAHDLAQRILKQGGSFLVKVFQGEGSDAFIQGLKQDFKEVLQRKPKASRPRSREIYVLARGFKV
jgi:23S rRNA (uridine2552-2'-O)-methyltransferase